MKGRDADERPAIEVPLTPIGLVETGQQVEQRRLACAVRPDERGDRVPLDVESLDRDGLQATEGAAYSTHRPRIASGFSTPGSAATTWGASVIDQHLLAPAEDAWGRNAMSTIRPTPNSAKRIAPTSVMSITPPSHPCLDDIEEELLEELE